jgi:hypothetical protein
MRFSIKSAIVAVFIGLTCALLPVAAQQAGGAFLPAFNYSIPGSWAFTGTNTHSGTETFSGTTTVAAAIVSRPTVINLVPTAVTLSAADSAKVSIQTLASGTQTYTLPLASAAPGAVFTFICQHASSEILINPNAADQVSIKGLVDHSTSVKPAAGTGVKNTAATNVIGDHLTLVSDGVATWYEVAGAGIWASQ